MYLTQTDYLPCIRVRGQARNFVFKGDKKCLSGSCVSVRLASLRPNTPLPIPTAESVQKLPVKSESESTLLTETIQKLPVNDSCVCH